MEDVYACNNIRKFFAVVSKLEKKLKPPSHNLTTDGNGKLLESAEQPVQRWTNFLKAKFDDTQRDLARTTPSIQKHRSPTSVLTRVKFDKSVNRMTNNKVVGPDRIPVEAVKYCPEVRVEIINSIWTSEKIPVGFVTARFAMLYKKQSVDDPVNYRCIVLLNHEFKVLSQIMLACLTTQRDDFLQTEEPRLSRQHNHSEDPDPRCCPSW